MRYQNGEVKILNDLNDLDLNDRIEYFFLKTLNERNDAS